MSIILSRFRSTLDRSTSKGHVLRGALAAFTVRALGIVVAYLVQVLLACWTGSTQYGLYVYAWTWLTVLAMVVPVSTKPSSASYPPTSPTRSGQGHRRAMPSADRDHRRAHGRGRIADRRARSGPGRLRFRASADHRVVDDAVHGGTRVPRGHGAGTRFRNDGLCPEKRRCAAPRPAGERHLDPGRSGAHRATGRRRPALEFGLLRRSSELHGSQPVAEGGLASQIGLSDADVAAGGLATHDRLPRHTPQQPHRCDRDRLLPEPGGGGRLQCRLAHGSSRLGGATSLERPRRR